MAKPVVHSHTYQHFADLQLSAKDFYTNLKSLIEQYQYPNVTCKVVELNVGSYFSARRQYLHINMAPYNYYVCASPFGRSFFISWWLDELDNGFTIAMRKIPILRWFIDSGEQTYFQIDTELMFKNSIDALVREAVEKVAADHGFRQAELVDAAN